MVRLCSGTLLDPARHFPGQYLRKQVDLSCIALRLFPPDLIDSQLNNIVLSLLLRWVDVRCEGVVFQRG